MFKREVGKIKEGSIAYTYKYKYCPICHKKFCIPALSYWTYKKVSHDNKSRYFCSWGCLRADEKQKIENFKVRVKESRYKKEIIPFIIDVMEYGKELSTEDIVEKIKAKTGNEFRYELVRKRLNNLEDEGYVKRSGKVGKKTLWLKTNHEKEKAKEK